MKHACAFMLETDTVEWIKNVAWNLSRQRKRDVSLSEAFEHIALGHWKKTLRRQQEKRMEQKQDKKHAEKLLGLR